MSAPSSANSGSSSVASPTDTVIDIECNQQCAICCDDEPAGLWYLRRCRHGFCRSCLTLHLQMCVSQSLSKVVCPQPQCDSELAFDDAALLLADHPMQLDALSELLMRRCLVADPEARFCPSTGCSAAVIAGANTNACPRMQCPSKDCDTAFCYHCRAEWHEGECSTSADEMARLLGDGMKPCPKCRSPIEKNDGCNEVKCRICGTSFCWFCGQTDISGLHFMGRGACPMYSLTRRKRRWTILRSFLVYLFGFPLAVLLISLLLVVAIPGVPILLAIQFYKQERQRTSSACALVLKTTLVILCLGVMAPVAVLCLALVLLLLAFVYIYCGRPLLSLINLDFLNRTVLAVDNAVSEN